MGHFELNSGSRNTRRMEKPRKRVHSTEIRLLGRRSLRNHEIRVALISDIKIKKDKIYYLERIRKISFSYVLPLACLLSILTFTLFAAKNTLALISRF